MSHLRPEMSGVRSQPATKENENSYRTGAFRRMLDSRNRFVRFVSLSLMVLCLSAFGSCRRDRQPPPAGFVTFDAFVQQVRSAKPEDYVGKPGRQVESAAAFQEMQAHLLKLYEGVTVSHSFYDKSHYVDCVPIDQQPGLRRPGAPREKLQRDYPKTGIVPAERKETTPGPERKTEKIDITLKSGVRDSFGQELYCSEGTIPFRRLTLEEMTRFKNLRSFFTKGSIHDNFELRNPRNNLPGDESHYYARGVQFVDNIGADSWLNVWSPTVADNQMSLSQQWIVGGDGDTKQTAEGGWQAYPNKYDTNDACLFIFWTSAGYTNGCYNLDCSGFVQIANNVYLGSGFDHYSTANGTQWGFNLQWQRNTDGNWWLFYRGPGNYIAVGYYPHSLYGSGVLATKATKVAFGGEDTGQLSAKQMGSGQKASTGWQKSAFQNMIFYIDTSRTSQWANLSKYESNPDCYTADIHNIFGNWGTYLFFGGPSCN